MIKTSLLPEKNMVLSAYHGVIVLNITGLLKHSLYHNMIFRARAFPSWWYGFTVFQIIEFQILKTES